MQPAAVGAAKAVTLRAAAPALGSQFNRWGHGWNSSLRAVPNRDTFSYTPAPRPIAPRRLALAGRSSMRVLLSRGMVPDRLPIPRNLVILALLPVIAAGIDAGTPSPKKDALGDPLPEAAVARLGTSRLWHPDSWSWPWSVAFSP